jgi:heterodisulfide reductase subunit A
LIAKSINGHGLNRVVVAACSPSLHEHTFQNCLKANGLNPYLVEMVNIREQCSWVHDEKEKATQKAIELIKMMIAKVTKNRPLFNIYVPVEKKALVVGAGISGIQTALDIAQAGFKVTLVEKGPSIGGRMAQLEKTFPTLDCSACILTPKMAELARNPNVSILTYSELEDISGYIGNFVAKIRKKARYVDMSKCTGCGICYQKCPVKVSSEFELGLAKRRAIYVPFPQAVPNIPVIDKQACTYFKTGKCKACEKFCSPGAIDFNQQDEIIEEKFGAIIIATGYDLFDWSVYSEYGAGRFKDVITGLQFERILNASGPTKGEVIRPYDGKRAKTVLFIQCVGSRDEAKGVAYCSKICCMYTAKQALLLKEHVPDAKVYVFYIDIRAGGKNYEEFVERVQDEYGVLYLRGRISKIYQRKGKLIVKGTDTLSGIPVEVEADLVVLATAMAPRRDAVKLAQMLRIPYDNYGFYTEAHAKLAPVETATGGIFLAGACQFPRDIPDSVASGSASAAKVIALLSHDELEIEPLVAKVDQLRCNGCFDCKSVCPYGAIEEEITRDKRRVAKVITSLCHGCGNCATACRSAVIDLEGFTDEQVFVQMEAL